MRQVFICVADVTESDQIRLKVIDEFEFDF